MIAAVIAAASLVVASVAIGRTPLGALNFGLLQWFGVRLCASFEPDLIAEVVVPGDFAPPGRWWSKYAPSPEVPVSWSLLRWVWPLTGWWSSYRWIARCCTALSVAPGLLAIHAMSADHAIWWRCLDA